MGIGWFLIALASPFLSAVTNLIDKYLTGHMKKKEAPIGVLLLYSTLFSALVLPAVVVWNGGLDVMNLWSVLILITAGGIEVCAIALYLFALSKEEASIVVPLFQFTPIFGYVFGLLLLGEALTGMQILSGCLVIAGGVVLSLEFSEESRLRLKKAVLILMLGSSAAYALFDVLFKYAGSSDTFWTVVFWHHVGILCSGLLLALFVPAYRKGFIANVTGNGGRVLGLNILNESLYAIGIFCFNFALFFAPVAMVMMVSVYQPVFVFVLGIMATLLFPAFLSEKISARHLLHKLIGIGIIVTGSVLLLL